MGNKDIIKRIKPVKTSIERQIFPYMAAEGKLYMMQLKGYWMDIGQPADYLIGQNLHLADLRSRESETASYEMCTEPYGETADKSGSKSPVARGPILADAKLNDICKILGNVIVDPDAKIAGTCVLGPNVVI